MPIRGREVRLDLRRDEPSEIAFAAFYADCLHEVLPVVSGYRLALIYNLIRTGDDTWRHPDGSYPDLGPLPFELEELSPPGAFDDLEPNELELQEATGNEGASFDRLYQRAALVVWPRTHRAAVLSQGGLRIAEPLEPPANWRRPNQVTCTCANCQELSRFLADSTRPEWAFRAAQRHRDHVAASVRTDRCDLDLVTERCGSPHTLRCTKNQASYLRRVVQREGDLAHLAQLGESPRPEGAFG